MCVSLGAPAINRGTGQQAVVESGPVKKREGLAKAEGQAQRVRSQHVIHRETEAKKVRGSKDFHIPCKLSF